MVKSLCRLFEVAVIVAMIVANGQEVVVACQDDATVIGSRLVQDANVRAALEAARLDEEVLIADQIRLCEIPAPPFLEADRALFYRERFERLGLENVRIDKVGNVLGERKGQETSPHLVFSAHLDTVFVEGSDVRVTRHGNQIKGLGISDDCRGLAVVLGVIRALNTAKVKTVGRITFVGTVGEEGLGDLRGVKHLFDEELRTQVDRFVSVDGAGLSITHIGVGSRRYRITLRGPGGHSYGSFGMVNPIHALGRLVQKIARFQVPLQHRTTFNVGRIGGGTSINSIASEAWMEIDLRSTDAAALKFMDTKLHDAIDLALREESERWDYRGHLSADRDLVGDRPVGRTRSTLPIVDTAISVTEIIGLPVRLGAGSTDANIPMSLGIPALTIGGGGKSSGVHSFGETFDSTDSLKGTQRAILLAIALTEN